MTPCTRRLPSRHATAPSSTSWRPTLWRRRTRRSPSCRARPRSVPPSWSGRCTRCVASMRFSICSRWRRGGPPTVFAPNRRYDRAIGLAKRFGGTAVRFDDLPAELARADIVVSCTSSPHQIFGREELEVVVEERGRRPLVLIDIAVPRDIEPSVRDLCSGVTLFDMDDLQREVARNLSVREAEADKARGLIDEDAGRFDRWLDTLDVVPTITALRERAERIVEQVLRDNEQRWERLSDADRERVGMMARAIVKRLLHEPTLRLKQGDDVYEHLHALRELFDLEPELREPRPAEVTDIETRRARRR